MFVGVYIKKTKQYFVQMFHNKLGHIKIQEPKEMMNYVLVFPYSPSLLEHLRARKSKRLSLSIPKSLGIGNNCPSDAVLMATKHSYICQTLFVFLERM